MVDDSGFSLCPCQLHIPSLCGISWSRLSLGSQPVLSTWRNILRIPFLLLFLVDDLVTECSGEGSDTGVLKSSKQATEWDVLFTRRFPWSDRLCGYVWFSCMKIPSRFIALDWQDIYPRDIKSRLTISSATWSCEWERTFVPLLLKNGICCFDRGWCEMVVVAFTSLCSTYSLCSFSSIVSIFLVVLRHNDFL